MVLQKRASPPECLFGDRQNGNAQLHHGVEYAKANGGKLKRTITVKDFLQHLGIGAGIGTIAGGDSFEKPLTRLALETLPAGGVHENVGVDQDHV